MIVFWEKGFAGASLTDLTGAMGINGPSMYAAFGDKKALYMQCVDRYVSKYGAEPTRCLNDPDNIDEALTGFFLAIVDNVSGGKTPLGCLVVCTLLETALIDNEVTCKLEECINMTDYVLEERFKLAKADGQLASGTDPILLGKLANSLRHGLVVRARSGATKSALTKQAMESVRLLLGRE